MNNLIVYVFLIFLGVSCAKKNQPVPAVPNYCIFREFKYFGAFSNDLQQYAKVYSTYRTNKYEMDSIVEADINGNYLRTLICRKFDSYNNLIEEHLPDKKYYYTIVNNKCVSAQELSLTNNLLGTFDYEYSGKSLTKVVIHQENATDTIELFYPYDYGQIIIRPIKITRNGGKKRYYREYDYYDNLIKESFAEYSNANSPDSLEKQEVIYTKSFNILSENNFTIQKYLLGKDIQNLLHTKFHNVFHLGLGTYIPLLDIGYNTKWETSMVLNEQNLLKSSVGGLYEFYNISEVKYTCE